MVGRIKVRKMLEIG